MNATDAGTHPPPGSLREFPGVITCPAVSSLRIVASIMATNRIHCVVVSDLDERGGATRGWGLVSDVDLMSAAACGDASITAGQIAASDPVTLDAGESVERACQLMAEHVSHLLVLKPGSSWPAGVLSSLDVARVTARLR